YLDDRSILTVSEDFVAQIWDVATGKQLRRFDMPLPIQGIGPKEMAISGDGRRIAYTQGIDAPSPKTAVVRVWDVAAGKEMCTVPVQADLCRALALSYDGRTLAVITPYPAVELYSGIGDGDAKMRTLAHPRDMAPGGRLEFSGPGHPLPLMP